MIVIPLKMKTNTALEDVPCGKKTFCENKNKEKNYVMSV